MNNGAFMRTIIITGDDDYDSGRIEINADGDIELTAITMISNEGNFEETEVKIKFLIDPLEYALLMKSLTEAAFEVAR